MWRSGIKLVIFIICCANGVLSAQTLKVFHKYEDDTLKIRWILNDPVLWEQVIQDGFILKKYDSNGGLINNVEIKHELNSFLNQDSTFRENTLAKLILKNEVDPVLYDETFPPDIYSDEDILIERHAFSDLILNNSFDFTLYAGFGYLDDDVQLTDAFRYTIEAVNPDLKNEIFATLEFDAFKYQSPNCPELIADWGNEIVNLSWDTRNFKDLFYGYRLSVSENDGPFNIVDSLLINAASQDQDSLLHVIKKLARLKDNDSKYRFAVRAYDYFGELSLCESQIVGYGRQKIGLSPAITSTKQLISNEVEIEWSILDQFVEEVRSWNLYYGQNWEGPYSLDTSFTNGSIRETIRPIPFPQSYFRIAAVDVQGEEFSSFPQLVINYDTIAPEIPENLEGSINEVGLVDLKWDESVAEDLAGYKVFYGFDSLAEMTLAHKRILKEPSFHDTIGLKSINENIYYKVISVDRRNNRSDFSDILLLKKSDLLPPVEPHIYQINPGPGSVELKWYLSASPDVERYELFRRNLKKETNWTPIYQWQSSDSLFSYKDSSDLIAFDTYAYTIICEDDDGNRSEPSEPAIVEIFPDHTGLDMNLWQILKLDGNSASFNHSYSDPEIEYMVLFKKTSDEPVYSIAKIPLETKRLEFEGVNPDDLFSIQIYYKDGFQSGFSAFKTLEK